RCARLLRRRALQIRRAGSARPPSSVPRARSCAAFTRDSSSARTSSSTAARTRERSEARGTAMIDLYYWTTPNGHKITIFLEEMGLPYTIKPVNISKGEQFDPAFLKIAPNNRIPTIGEHAQAA